MRISLRALGIVLVVGLAALAQACAPSATQNGQNSQNYQVREITAVGDSEYFPLRSGSFLRTRIFAYGAEMEDISIGYNSTVGEQPSATTVYFYPANRPQGNAVATLEFEFENVKKTMARHPGGQWEVRREQVVVEQPSGPVEGLTATYRYTTKYQGRSIELLTVLHLFLDDDRLIKFRHTYPASDADFYRALIENLMSELRWLGVNAQNVGARLGQASEGSRELFIRVVPSTGG